MTEVAQKNVIKDLSNNNSSNSIKVVEAVNANKQTADDPNVERSHTAVVQKWDHYFVNAPQGSILTA